MDLVIAATLSKKMLDGADLLPDEHGSYGKDHIDYMLSEIIQQRVTGEKAHRWLGWAQCAICMGGGASLERLKEINHKS